MASWFETRGVAALLTMRTEDGPHPEQRCLPRVSKDEATALENALPTLRTCEQDGAIVESGQFYFPVTLGAQPRVFL
jgi:hypothetical protein